MILCNNTKFFLKLEKLLKIVDENKILKHQNVQKNKVYYIVILNFVENN